MGMKTDVTFQTSKISEVYLHCRAFFQDAKKRLTKLCEDLLSIQTLSQGDLSPRRSSGVYHLRDHTPCSTNLLSYKMGIVISPLQALRKSK